MLTDGQEKILKKSLDILSFSNRLLIKGSAGVGKTYLTRYLIEQLIFRSNSHLNIVCTAPTNKAVAVLRENIPNNYEFSTTHSALNLKRNIDDKTGDIYFTEKSENPLINVDILLIDESSMISTDLLEYIEKHGYDTKVIFLGDNKQINPVNEKDTPVFKGSYLSVELKEIIRQKKGNAIINLSRNLDLLDTYKSNISDNKGFVFTNNYNKVLDELSTNTSTRYISWTNVEINTMNKRVRHKIYSNPRKIELNEVLVFNKPYGTYFTNEEITVDKLSIIQKTYKYPLNTYKSSGIDLKCYLINKDIIVIHEDDENKYKKLVRDLRKKARKNLDKDAKDEEKIKWVDFYKFIENFADIKYNYAITVHKSQGSTYKRVIINLVDINRNKNLIERKRLLYTAITRASELVVLYIPKFND